jgi:hypothetical protein
MSDFDPDSYLIGKKSSAPAGFDPDAYLIQAHAPKTTLTGDSGPKLDNSWWGAIKGDTDVALAAGTRAVVSPFAALARTVNRVIPDWDNTKAQVQGNINAIENRLEYDPKTEEGKYALSQVGKVVQPIAEGISKATGAIVGDENVPAVADIAGSLPLLAAPRAVNAFASGAKNTRDAIKQVAGIPARAWQAAVERGKPSAQELLNANAASQSMGAAAAAPNLAAMSPELRAAVTSEAQRTGGAVNAAVLARHAEADSLPVKMQLTEGQATQDPTILSNEMNSRGSNKALADRYNQQNEQLKENLQEFRDRIGPDVYTAQQVEHGDTLIDAYKKKAAAADADVTAKYQALRDANNGDFPADPKQLVTNANAALKQQMLSSKAPKDVMASLQEAADRGSISLDEFETARTRLAQIARSSADGQERYAAGVVRQEMENLPIAGNATKLKGLADDARGAARAQFQALEADPAYKAAVNDSVSPDRFVQKYIVNGSRDDVAKMRANLADNPTAQQTMGVATLDHLRQSAGVDDMGNNNFSQARYNKALQALSPKIRSLVGASTADQLETLGNVARYTQAQSRGSFVNNSNTFVAQAGARAASMLEGAANLKTGGIGGTMVRNYMAGRAQAKATREALKPGAGLSHLDIRP